MHSVALLSECVLCCCSCAQSRVQVFGIIRVPLYTLPNGLGLPGFLKNAFISNSLVQLGLALTRGRLLTEAEWAGALKTSGHVTGQVTQTEIDY